MVNRKKASRRRAIVVGALAASLAAFVTGSVIAASAAAPTNTQEPSITGSPAVGKDLTGNNGLWTGTGNTYARKWLRCDAAAANCAAIAGATGGKYKVTSADLGKTIRFEVTATNPEGTKTAQSNATAVVSNPTGIPANTAAPVVSGTTTVGSTLSSTTGTWIGDNPITYTYQWQKCDKAGNACKNIGKATAATYKLVQGDVGSTIRSKVTGKNTRGKSSAISAQTAVVTDAAGGGGGGTPGGGIINLPGGGKSVDVSDVPKGERLIVNTVTFNPNPVRSKTKPITVTITVKDTRGYFVRNAFVFLRSTPIVTSTPKDAQTADDGKIVYSINPESDFPIKNGYSVQFFVKAYKKGDPALAGISGTRLVQVPTKK